MSELDSPTPESTRWRLIDADVPARHWLTRRHGRGAPPLPFLKAQATPRAGALCKNEVATMRLYRRRCKCHYLGYGMRCSGRGDCGDVRNQALRGPPPVE